MPRNPSARRAFTLVEALVAVAVVGTLVGVLVPTLASMRDAARDAACRATQRDLYLAAFQRAVSDSGRIPGVNTTGARYLTGLEPKKLLGDTTPSTPTSVFDWISPSLGASRGFSPNRAERTRQIFADLACAGVDRFNTDIYSPGPLDDRADFESLHLRDGFPQISYLSPVAFHLMGPRQSGSPWSARFHYPWRGPIVTPVGYEPRLELVGSHAHKIMIADGTRYLAAADLLDFDIHPRPRYFGSFTTSGPIYIGSRAYGDTPRNTEFADENHSNAELRGANKQMSYRHKGRINAAYFDGHVDGLTEAESKSDAGPWYPRGSVYTGFRAADQAEARYSVGDVIP